MSETRVCLKTKNCIKSKFLLELKNLEITIMAQKRYE
ncbi:MAG: hypothetical protein K0R05_4123, partial [Anaerocolumna sp.]|nr:hypothetical protein [Anaerocolumna sp.]